MFIKEMEKNEQLAFLKLVAYSLSAGRMVQKDSEDTDSYLAPKILLDYLLEMEFKGSDVVRAYRTMGKGYKEILGFANKEDSDVVKNQSLKAFTKQVEEFLTDKTDPSLMYVKTLLWLKTSEIEVGRVIGNAPKSEVKVLNFGGISIPSSLLQGIQPLSKVKVKHKLPENFNQDFDQIYNLPKDLREITHKKIFLCEVLDFYENIPCECFVKEDFIDQICHFLRIDSEGLKECQNFLKEIKDSQEKINQATLASIQTFQDITHKLKGHSRGQEQQENKSQKKQKGEENEQC